MFVSMYVLNIDMDRIRVRSDGMLIMYATAILSVRELLSYDLDPI